MVKTSVLVKVGRRGDKVNEEENERCSAAWPSKDDVIGERKAEEHNHHSGRPSVCRHRRAHRIRDTKTAEDDFIERLIPPR